MRFSYENLIKNLVDINPDFMKSYFTKKPKKTP